MADGRLGAIRGALQGLLPRKCHRPGVVRAHEDATHSAGPRLCSQQYSQRRKKLFAPEALPPCGGLELLGHLFSAARGPVQPSATTGGKAGVVQALLFPGDS